MAISYRKLFNESLQLSLDDIRSGLFKPESEADIQALIFHQAFKLADHNRMSPDFHAEPTKLRKKPDLVFGDNEVFVEIKFSKQKSGGNTNNCDKKWPEAVDKLRQYRSHWPHSKQYFLAITTGTYLNNSSSENYFDPQQNQLLGSWKKLRNGWHYLVGRPK